MRFSWVAAIGVSGASVAFVPNPASGAQAKTPSAQATTTEQKAPGRLGVRFLSRREYTLGSGQPARTLVIIEEVLPGSAAQRAGMRAGDVVIQINGMFPSEALLTQIGPQLRAGDSLRLVVDRAGQSVDRWVVAEARPAQTRSSETAPVLVRDDGLPGPQWPMGWKQADLEGSEGFTIVWKGGQGPNQSFSYNFEMSQGGGDLPFDAFVVRTPLTDSLMTRIQLVRRQIGPTTSRTSPSRDLSQRQVELARELGELQGQLATVSRDQLRLTDLSRDGRDVRVRFSPNRAIAPLMQTNRAFLLGAEVTSVNAELGRYFQVDGGVLISSVPPGTPAEHAGLRPGDVIVATSRGSVQDFMELRRHLLAGGTGLKMTVVRAGAERTIVFPEQQ